MPAQEEAVGDAGVKVVTAHLSRERMRAVVEVGVGGCFRPTADARLRNRLLNTRYSRSIRAIASSVSNTARRTLNRL